MRDFIAAGPPGLAPDLRNDCGDVEDNVAAGLYSLSTRSEVIGRYRRTNNRSCFCADIEVECS